MNLEFVFLSLTTEPIHKEMVLQHIHDGIYNFSITKKTTVKELFEQFRNRFKENRLLAVENFISFNEENFKDNLEEYYQKKLINSDDVKDEDVYYANVYFRKF